jgi:hypothetical protein
LKSAIAELQEYVKLSGPPPIVSSRLTTSSNNWSRSALIRSRSLLTGLFTGARWRCKAASRSISPARGSWRLGGLDGEGTGPH